MPVPAGGKEGVLMPYVMEKLTGARMVEVATDKPPFGPGFSPEEVEEASSMEIIGSTVSDPGPDWCEFVLLDKDGSRVGCTRVPGY